MFVKDVYLEMMPTSIFLNDDDDINIPTFKILCKTFVHPHLEYCVQVSSLHLRKDINTQVYHTLIDYKSLGKDCTI